MALEEARTISRKDQELNSLVNFGDLSKAKKEEDGDGEDKKEEKPVYIKPAETSSSAQAFVPQPMPIEQTE